MTSSAPGVTAQANNFNWLVNRFAQDTAGCHRRNRRVLRRTADCGLLWGGGADAERLGAISSAMLSLANGVGECHPIGTPDKIVIELTYGYLLVCTISIGCSLGVLASKQASLGTLAYEMAIFANRAGPILTPQLIEELKLSVRT